MSRVPICGNVHYEEEGPHSLRRLIGEEDMSEDEYEEDITRTIEKEFKLRNLDEEEKLSAGKMMNYRKQGIYQSVAGIKGS